MQPRRNISSPLSYSFFGGYQFGERFWLLSVVLVAAPLFMCPITEVPFASFFFGNTNDKIFINVININFCNNSRAVENYEK